MIKPSPRAARILRLLVSGALVAWLISRAGISELGDALQDASVVWMLLALVSVVPSIAVRAFSLHTITNKDGRVVTFGQSYALTLIGVASSLFLPPGVADAARAHIGYRALGKPERIVSASLLDRATSLIALGILGAAAAALEGAVLISAAAAAIGLLALAAVMAPRLLPWSWTVRALSGGTEIDPERLRDATRMRPATLALIVAVSISGWLTTALTTYLICLSLGAGVGFATVTLATLLAALSRLVPVSAAGIGVGEWTLALYLTRAGVPADLAAAVALTAMVFGVIAPGIAGLTVRLRRPDSNAASAAIEPVSVSGATLRPMRPADVPAVVDVHKGRLTGSLLDGLGPGFLMLYYEHLCTDPHGVALVAEDGARDRIVGFAAGTTTTESIYRQMVRQHLLRSIGLTLVRLLADPGAVIRAIGGFRSSAAAGQASGDSGRVPATGEYVLQAIAVSAEAEGTGLGTALLDAFVGFARDSGAPAVTLVTDEIGNEGVREFYERRGFALQSGPEASGARRIVRYRLTLPGTE